MARERLCLLCLVKLSIPIESVMVKLEPGAVGAFENKLVDVLLLPSDLVMTSSLERL